jgi:hypothetical protein
MRAMRGAFGCGMLAGALVLAAAPPSRAQDAPAAGPVVQRDAQARFVEGIARVKAGDYEAARVSFKQAYAVLHKPEILWNLALAEQKSGHLVDAITHFKQVQRDAPGKDDRTAAGKHVTDLTSQTAHIDVAAPPGSQVSLDGASVGVAPLNDTLDVEAGRHHIEIRSGQGASKAADADAVVGQVAHVNFLVADSSPPTVAAAPVPPVASPTDAQPASPPAPDAPTDTTSHGTFWDARGITVVTLGGLAVISAGMGLAFGIVSGNDAGTASTLRAQNPSCSGFSTPGCQQLQSTTQSEHSAFVTSEVFWVTGAVLAAGAVGAWFLWPKAAPASAGGATSVRVVPAAGGGGAGVLAVGSF